MPNRWKERIKRHFSREVYLNKLLKKLSTNSDINFEVVKQDKKKAEKLSDEIKKISGKDSTFIIADLSSQKEIIKATDIFKNKNMRKKEMMLNKKRKNMRRKQDSK